METREGDAGGLSFRNAAPMAFDRTAGWKYYLDRGDVFEADGEYYFTSREAIRFAHDHPEIFSSARAYGMVGSPVPLIPLAIDRPEHIRYRRVLDPMLAPRVVNAMEDNLRALINDLIDGFIGTGRCDVINDIAVPYPSTVIMTLFGLPLEDLDKFLSWVQLIVEASGSLSEPSPEQAEGAISLFTYLQGFIEKKRAEPGDDLISSVLALEGDEAWSDEELLGLCFLFVMAGLDTVTASIGFVMSYLAKDPEMQRRLGDQPDLIAPFIEEVLRLELPAPMTPRVTTEDVEVSGHHIPEGSTCVLVLAAANRDKERGDGANSIDLEQANRGHLSFGGGIHRCLGSHLARRELRLVVEEFIRRIPQFSIAEGYEPRLVWPTGTFHLEALPLEFTSGGVG